MTDTEETEKNYFQGLKNSIPTDIRDRIVIKVEKAKTTYNLVDRTLELCSAQAQQRIPWIVFDRDRVKNFDGIIREAESNDISGTIRGRSGCLKSDKGLGYDHPQSAVTPSGGIYITHSYDY